MGFVGSLLGGNSGNSFQAQSAPIMNTVTPDQLNAAATQTNSGINQQQSFLNALQAQGGLSNQSNVFNQQQGLANQYQNIANGNGPNPAMAQLAQTTGQNIQNQGAMQAGQRGAGANVGLMARQIGQQGAATQQQAVGQGATMEAQQQLAAMQGLQNQQAMMGNMANTQVGQQAQGLAGLNQYGLANQGQLLGAAQGLNQSNVSNVASQNSANAGVAEQASKNQMSMFGGALNGLGTAGSWLAGLGTAASSGGTALAGGFGDAMGAIGATGAAGATAAAPAAEGAVMLGAKGGEIPDAKKFASMVAQHLCSGGMSYDNGGKVPGEAEVKGDSLKNDKVPAMLSPHEIVIPRSIALHPNAPELAKQFVQQIISKRK